MEADAEFTKYDELFYEYFHKITSQIRADDQAMSSDVENTVYINSGYLIPWNDSSWYAQQRLVNKWTNWITKEIGNLFVAMLCMEGIKGHKYTDNGNRHLHLLCDFFIEEGNKKIAYIINPSPHFSQIKTYPPQLKEEGFSNLIKLNLVTPTESDFENQSFIKNGILIKTVNVEEFFLKYFSGAIFNRFIDYLENAKNEIRLSQGFAVVPKPNKDTIRHFINETVKRNLLLTPEKLNPSDYPVIDDFTKMMDSYKSGRFKVMIGDASFAQSLIAQEWQWKVSTILSSELEKTSLVVGYVKSVEQLLYTILKTIDRKLTFKEGKEPTLFVLIGELMDKKRKWAFEVSPRTRSFIIEQLKDWRGERNDISHRKLIESLGDAEAIREKAFVIYFLLLGAMKISSEDLSEMEGTLSKSKNEIIQSQYQLSLATVSSWLDKYFQAHEFQKIFSRADLIIFTCKKHYEPEIGNYLFELSCALYDTSSMANNSGIFSGSSQSMIDTYKEPFIFSLSRDQGNSGEENRAYADEQDLEAVRHIIHGYLFQLNRGYVDRSDNRIILEYLGDFNSLEYGRIYTKKQIRI